MKAVLRGALISTMLFGFLPLPTFAAITDYPDSFCKGNPDCTPEMHRISRGFSSGNAQFAGLDFSAFSGGCYHLNPLYDKNWTHHGAFVFEKRGGETLATGLFSFFAPENPWAGMSAEELKAYLLTTSNPAPARLTSRELILEYLTGDSEIVYWFRSDSEGKNLFLIGMQQDVYFHSAVFCELARAPEKIPNTAQ